jgi:outer membrane protein, heavy metal efflux system
VRTIFPVLLLIAATLPVFERQASAQHIISEDDVVRAILADDPVIEAARIEALAAEQRPGQVVWPFPMLDVAFMPSMIADGETGVEFMARQRVPWPGLLAERRSERRFEAESTQADARSVERERILEGRLAFAGLWLIQRERDLIGTFVDRIDIFEESALSTYAAGRGPQQSVIQVQLERERLLQRQERLDDEETALRSDIERLTGGRIPIGADLTLAPPPSPTPRSMDRERLAEAMLIHPQVTSWQSMQRAAESATDVARLEGRPEITLGANVNLSPMARERMYGLEPVMPVVGVSLPLWRSGIRAEVEEQRLRSLTYEAEASAAMVALQSEVSALLTQLDRTENRIGRLRDRLRPRVDVALESTLTALRAGTARTIELLDLERSALEIDIEILTEELRRAELYARLRSILGE